MSNIFKKESKGFTLIEVVIVLAIAALIILVVLQAVGAAQRSNRDAARKSEAGRMVALLEQYSSNNGGKYPADVNAFTAALTQYDANLGAKYTPAATCVSPVVSTTFSIAYVAGANNRDYTLTECLEAGGAVVVTH